MPEPIATWNPARSVWETDQPSLCGHSVPYSVTWPDSGTTRSGTAWRLPRSVRHITGSGSSSSPVLPTPEAYGDAGRGGSQHPDKRRAGGHSVRLSDVTEQELLPTPAAADGMGGHTHRSGPRSAELLLPGVVEAVDDLLPTPTAMTLAISAREDYHANLVEAVGHAEAGSDPRAPLLPTPVVNDMGSNKTFEWWDEWTERFHRPLYTSLTQVAKRAEEGLLPTPRSGMREQVWERPEDEPQNLENALARIKETSPDLLPTPLVTDPKTVQPQGHPGYFNLANALSEVEPTGDDGPPPSGAGKPSSAGHIRRRRKLQRAADDDSPPRSPNG